MIKQTFKVEHHIFCASKKKRGINTFLSSTSISQEEISEIENIASYNPPFLLPNQPSVDEIENLFPVNYAFGRLKNNVNFIMHSIYTGRNNHTPDRFGNFLTHTILLDNFNNKIKVPYLFENIDFVRNIKSEDEDSFILPEEIINFDIIGNDMSNLIERHVSFLNLDPTQLNSFLAIVDILIDEWLAKDSKNKITIMSDKEVVKNLILSLYTLLPAFLINKISFATYLINPEKYPFQINGIIPECGIKALDEKFNKLIIVNKQLEYKPKNDFTSYILTILTKDDNHSHSFKFLEDILIEFNINSFSSRLNSPISTLKFRDNIAQETIASFINLLKNEISLVQREKLIEYVSVRNMTLYFEYIVFKFNEDLKFKYNFREKYSLFENYHKQYFTKNLDLFETHFYQFCLYFKSFLHDIEKLNFSYILITSFDSSRFLNKDELQEEIINVDNYFKESQNEEEFEKFFLKYGNLISVSYQNLWYMKVKRELLIQIQENTFLENIELSRENILLLSLKDRYKLFASAILSKNVISEFDLSFEHYIPIIEKYFAENSKLFWSYFFKQEESTTNKSHSLSYLKRYFIITVLPNIAYSECIKDLPLNDYEKYWLLEVYKENGDLISYNKLSPLINYNIKEPEKSYLWGLWKK